MNKLVLLVLLVLVALVFAETQVEADAEFKAKVSQWWNNKGKELYNKAKDILKSKTFKVKSENMCVACKDECSNFPLRSSQYKDCLRSCPCRDETESEQSFKQSNFCRQYPDSRGCRDEEQAEKVNKCAACKLGCEFLKKDSDKQKCLLGCDAFMCSEEANVESDKFKVKNVLKVAKKALQTYQKIKGAGVLAESEQSFRQSNFCRQYPDSRGCRDEAEADIKLFEKLAALYKQYKNSKKEKKQEVEADKFKWKKVVDGAKKAVKIYKTVQTAGLLAESASEINKCSTCKLGCSFIKKESSKQKCMLGCDAFACNENEAESEQSFKQSNFCRQYPDSRGCRDETESAKVDKCAACKFGCSFFKKESSKEKCLAGCDAFMCKKAAEPVPQSDSQDACSPCFSRGCDCRRDRATGWASCVNCRR